ncbi:MAG TPA: hypothetical protein VK658_10290 [Chryseolinea sp.]|nr:hypothetical protein [Chryseolinea sp.]
MAYKATEQELMAYLYGELEGVEKQVIEKYLQENSEARAELEKLKSLRQLMANVRDKEVIAPPLFLGDGPRVRLLDTPYVRTILSVAASLLLLMLVGRVVGMRMGWSGNELSIGFGAPVERARPNITPPVVALTPGQVQEMINTAVSENNLSLQTNWVATQQKLDASINRNLDLNSAKIDRLVKESSAASQDQIREFVAGMQTENLKVVKGYFQLSSTEQKQYIEGLLVDFSKYLQQQRNDDLQVVQTQLKSLEQNTDLFKQETEQILTSIISTVGSGKPSGTMN